ncbi:Kinesin-like protein KLP1 [Bienertia sinuspersici]
MVWWGYASCNGDGMLVLGGGSRRTVAILSELVNSNKASDKLKMVYFPFLGLAVLAILRGMLPSSCKTISVGKKSVVAGRKKRA